MRARIFTGIILFFFGVLATGLFYTQVLRYGVYTELSEKNRIRVLSLEAPRGRIYDRAGRILVGNRVSFDVEVIYQELKEKDRALVDKLSSIFGIDRGILDKRIKEAAERPFVPVKIIEDVEKEKAIQIEEIRLDFPGLILTTSPQRDYIYKDALSHVSGYLGKISEDELSKYRTYGYRMQDYVGKDGIEKSYNEYLRGINGGLQIEVDARGRQLKVIATKKPRPGKDLYLTVDARLQEFCDSLLVEEKGAIVAMEPSTGEILALVSRPNFDPGAFVQHGNFREVSRLLNDRERFPLLNRAIAGAYPPGSVFKIVVAASAMESAVYDPRNTFSCKGTYRLGNRTFHCWKEKGHGPQEIREAIKNSCNVFFYQLGLFLGADRIAECAFRFGLGKPLGIDLPGENPGLVPTPAWKKKELKEKWYKGETANYAIGQGYLLLTPLQVLHMTNVIAGGRVTRPFIVDRIEDVSLRHAGLQDVRLRERTLKTVKEGLRRVVNAPGGTGIYARSKEFTIAGKTGTAQNPEGNSHAWFAGFAPFEEPAISVVVFVEHGGKGGLVAARFAKKIIEEARRLELF